MLTMTHLMDTFSLVEGLVDSIGKDTLSVTKLSDDDIKKKQAKNPSMCPT